MGKIARGDNNWAGTEEGVPEVLTSTWNTEKRAIGEAVDFSRQLAIVEPMEKKAPMTTITR